MNKIHKTTVPLYNMKLVFSQSIIKLNKTYNLDISTNCDACCCLSPDRKNIIIWVENKGDPIRVISNLAHESFHAANMVADWVGLDTSYNADEAIAYLISWLVQYCLKCMDKDCIV